MIQDWLLCDFHIHTTFSDGIMSIHEVVDLYGKEGFDAISITDHIFDEKSLADRKAENEQVYFIQETGFPAYLQVLWNEARRAWEQYHMLLIPGTEITNNTAGYHILAIDVKAYIEPTLSVEQIVTQIHEQGGIAIAPHPHRGSLNGTQELMFLWENRSRFIQLFDAWEVANRDDIFNVVGLKKFNYIANSDFHQPRHLYSWKTLIHCDKNTEAIKAGIRNNNGVSIYLFRKNKHLKTENS